MSVFFNNDSRHGFAVLRRLVAIAFLITIAMTSGTMAQDIPMRMTGTTDSRVDILILGDGYLSSEKTRFDHDAFRFYDELITNEPFRTYEHFLNVRRIFTPSNQRGASRSGQPGDTALGSYFTQAQNVDENGNVELLFNNDGSPLLTRLLVVDQGLVNQVLTANGYDSDPGSPDLVVVVVNERLRGGSGYSGVTVVSNFTPTSANQPLWTRVAIHEMGHSFASLGDEYDSTENPNAAPQDIALNQAVCQGNLDRQAGDETFLSKYGNIGASADRNIVPWRHWFSPDSNDPVADIDDPGNAQHNIDVFPGALACTDQFAKPSTHSTMRFEAEPFGNVNIELLLRNIHYRLYYPSDVKVRNATRQVFPLTSFDVTDSNGGVSFQITSDTEFHVIPRDTQALDFSFDYPGILQSGFSFRWELNGTTVSTLPILRVNSGMLNPDQTFNTLTVTVTDNTRRLVGDPDNKRTPSGDILLVNEPPVAMVPILPGALNASCTQNSDCNSRKCQGPSGNKTCRCATDSDCGPSGSFTCVKRGANPNLCGAMGLANGVSCLRDRQCLSGKCNRVNGNKICRQ